MDEEKKNVEVIEEKYIQVSESRIKNTIKEYKSGQSFSAVISTSFACMVSFLIAFASYPTNESPWKWVFLSMLIVSAIVFLVTGIIGLAKRKRGRGTEKWFLEEIRDRHDVFDEPEKKPLNKKLLFNVINVSLIILVPVSILLIFLACNNWNILNKDWTGVFFVVWIGICLASLVFGTYINAYFAYILFGYEDGFPEIMF